MRIGITERGDAGLDLSWATKLPGNFDYSILITKNITQEFLDETIRLHNQGVQLIVHATCTGLGGTVIEPHVPAPQAQLTALRALIDAGFPIKQTVLRIDPIIPTAYGLAAFKAVLALARDTFPEGIPRIRVSVMDNYPHVRKRFQAVGLDPVYDGAFRAPTDQFAAVSAIIADSPDLTFESCAELNLSAPNLERAGCVSVKDLAILGITPPDYIGTNPQNRSGCLCLQGKTDLLSRRQPCPHKCLYCYWKS